MIGDRCTTRSRRRSRIPLSWPFRSWRHWLPPPRILAPKAAGLGSRRVGAFYDDEVHRYLGLSPAQGQVVYHFAIGYPVPGPADRGLGHLMAVAVLVHGDNRCCQRSPALLRRKLHANPGRHWSIIQIGEFRAGCAPSVANYYPGVPEEHKLGQWLLPGLGEMSVALTQLLEELLARRCYHPLPRSPDLTGRIRQRQRSPALPGTDG